MEYIDPNYLMIAAIKTGRVRLIQDENGIIKTSHYLCHGGGQGYRFVENADAIGEEVDAEELFRKAELERQEYKMKVDEADKWVCEILSNAKIGIMPVFKERGCSCDGF